ncbi:MAG: hypothetical protein AAB348_03660 [Patescibacteria group bacterium]
MKLELTKKIIGTVSLLAVLALAIFLGIFYPTTRYIKKTSDDAYALRVHLEQKYQQSLKNRITRKKLEEIKTSYVSFIPHLFKIEDDLKYINYLDKLASTHKLTQDSTPNFGNIVNNQVVVSLNISGAYKNILEYMADLESADYFINIKYARLTPLFEPNGEVSNLANLSLTLELYVSS